MFEEKCCICGEIAQSPYGAIKHLDNGKSRIYSGHKRCLFLLETRLNNGDVIEFTEYDRTKI
jgi:hypothetical protein